MWRLVMAQIATLEEIDKHWSLADVIRANHALSLHLKMMGPAEADNQ